MAVICPNYADNVDVLWQLTSDSVLSCGGHMTQKFLNFHQEELTIRDLDGMPLPSSFAKQTPECQNHRKGTKMITCILSPIIQR